MIRTISAIAISLIMNFASKAQNFDVFNDGDYYNNFEPSLGFGMVGGWKSPYGWGLDIPYQIRPKTDINAGLGLALSGVRAGMGIRYHFFSDSFFTPFLAFNLSGNSGLRNFEIDTGNPALKGNYTIRPDITAHFRGGFLVRIFNIDFFLNIGYGQSFFHHRALFVSGYNSVENQTIADIFLPSGIEVSAGFKFSLSGLRNLF